MINYLHNKQINEPQVQESFVKACPGLPFLLRAHLQGIEEEVSSQQCAIKL